MKERELHIGMIGQGAISTLFAYYWKQAKVSILVRTLPRTQKRIQDLTNHMHIVEHPIKQINQANLASIDVLVITVKAYQTESLAIRLKDCINSSTHIVLIQNGMGGHEILAEYFPNNRIYAGITTDAIYAIDNRTYQITATGRLDLGEVTKESNVQSNYENTSIIKTFLAFHPCSDLQDNIFPFLYKKLAINAVINPLTAIKNIKNGDLLAFSTDYRALINEVYSVYKAMGLDTDLETLAHDIESVMKKTANNYSSMHQDVYYKRQTEVDSVLGYLIRQAETHQLSVSLMKTLYQQITENAQQS